MPLPKKLATSPKRNVGAIGAAKTLANLPERVSMADMVDLPFLLESAERIDGNAKFDNEYWRMKGHTADGGVVTVATGSTYVTPILAQLTLDMLPCYCVIRAIGQAYTLEDAEPFETQGDLLF